MGLILAKYLSTSTYLTSFHQRLSLIPPVLLWKGIVSLSTSSILFFYLFRITSWKYLGILSGIGIFSGTIFSGWLARRNPLVQMALVQYLPSLTHRYGIRSFQSIYLLTTTYQLVSSQRFWLPVSLISWHDQDDHYALTCYLTRSRSKIPKIILPPSYVVEYHVNNQKYPLPINLEISGNVDNGEFVLFKRVRKGMSYVLQECDRSVVWPTPYLERLLNSE